MSRFALAVLIAVFTSCAKRKEAPAPAPAASSATSAPAIMLEGRASATREVAIAVKEGHAAKLGARMAPGASVRVEVRKSLAETDERGSRTLASAADLERWLGEARAEWTCSGEGCKYPGGLVADGSPRCAGTCCRMAFPGGLEKGRLYLTRVCFGEANVGSAAQPLRSLALIELAEAN